MENLRWVVDMEGWETADDIRCLTAQAAQPDESRIVSYMKSAPSLWATALFHDRISGDADHPITSLNAYTDGTWIWTNELALYVERYHLRVPQEFAEHAASRNWKPPTTDELDLEQILTEIHGVAPISWESAFLVSYPGPRAILQRMLRANAHSRSADESRVLAYLRAGQIIFETDIEMEDIVAEEPTSLGRLRILTDGRYVWPNVLAFYVERYRYRLNEEFMAEILGLLAKPSRKYAPEQVRHAVLQDSSGDLCGFDKSRLREVPCWRESSLG